MIDLPLAITQYFSYIPSALFAFFITFLLTPMIGRFAKKYGFIDLPTKMRNRVDQTKDRRIHNRIVPRLGGLAIVIGFFITLTVFNNVPTDITGILIGIGILTINGILDDKYELSGKTQLLFQLAAAVVVVASGVTIEKISIAGFEQSFVNFSHQLEILGYSYNFLFPADLITIFWILLVTNALSWVCGIDALGESMTFIASLIFGALAMKLGSPEYTMIFFVFAGAVMGFIPFNFPNARIFGGTVGHLVYGFFLSTMAIQSQTKLVTATMILTLPLIDMLWVLIGRIKHNKLNSPLALLSISDRTHLHHRLMDIGFDIKQTLFLELAIFSIFSLAAFYLGGFSFDFILLSSGVVLAILLFNLISILYDKSWSKTPKPRVRKTIKKDTSPEERYAY